MSWWEYYLFTMMEVSSGGTAPNGLDSRTYVDWWRGGHPDY
jgi:hypothetical protein